MRGPWDGIRANVFFFQKEGGGDMVRDRAGPTLWELYLVDVWVQFHRLQGFVLTENKKFVVQRTF